METSTGEVTRLLQDLSDGSREALDKLLPLVYEELRRYLSRGKSPISIPGSPLDAVKCYPGREVSMNYSD